MNRTATGATAASVSPGSAMTVARLPERIVLGVADDWSVADVDRGATAWVAQQARTWRCPVTVVHAWMASGPTQSSWFDPAIWESAALGPGAIAGDVLRRLGLRVTAQAHRDSASDALVTALRPEDLVAVSAAASSPLRHGFGANVVHQLLRNAPCPIAIVPRSWQPPSGTPRIMVAYDDTARADDALGWAVAHCEAAAGELVLVWISRPHHDAPGSSSIRAEALQRATALATRHGITTISVLDVPGAGPGSSLDHAAARSDLLVLGNHESSWLEQRSRETTSETGTMSPSGPVVVLAQGGDLSFPVTAVR